jgi:hypothetical protein
MKLSGKEFMKWISAVLHGRPAAVSTLPRIRWGSKWQLLILVILLISMRHDFWSMRIGQSLVCTEELGQSDIILVENLDPPDYLLFERATELHKAGFASRIIVPVLASQAPEKANIVSQGIVEVMARVARMQAPETVPIQHREPISLNAALQLRDFLTKEYLRAVIVVTPGFRSKRSYLVYHSVFASSGITVYCMPVFGQKTPENWTKTWHGIQEVTKQFLKLQFYRFYVLWNRPA